MKPPKIRERKLGRERADGQQEPGLIEVDPRLTAKRRLLVVVHECLHEVAPEWEEERVEEAAEVISSVLWTDRWRRIEP